MARVRSLHWIDTIILISVILLLFQRVWTPALRFPDFQLDNFALLGEIVLWFLVLFLIFMSIRERGLTQRFVLAWKINWFLLIFLGVVGISITWSIFPAASAYRILVVLASTIFAIYFGLRYRLNEFLDILVAYGAVFVVLSYWLAMSVPVIGTMPWYPYWGAWRGAFWNRNFLGCLMTLLNLVYLFSFFCSTKQAWGRKFFAALFYILTLMLVVLSESATGIIGTVIMNSLFFLLFIWLSLWRRLKPIHYVWGLLVILTFITIGWIYRDFFLGLVNRNTTLTGRVHLWRYLFDNIISQRPWGGYGFGALWMIDTFRAETAAAIGWQYPVLFGDNGYVDILVNIGFIGFLSFICVLFAALAYAIRHVFRHRNLLDLLPLMVLVYALVVNISFSLFLEVESFVWFVIITSLTAIIPNGKNS